MRNTTVEIFPIRKLFHGVNFSTGCFFTDADGNVRCKIRHQIKIYGNYQNLHSCIISGCLMHTLSLQMCSQVSNNVLPIKLLCNQWKYSYKNFNWIINFYYCFPLFPETVLLQNYADIFIKISRFVTCQKYISSIKKSFCAVTRGYMYVCTVRIAKVAPC